MGAGRRGCWGDCGLVRGWEHTLPEGAEGFFTPRGLNDCTDLVDRTDCRGESGLSNEGRCGNSVRRVRESARPAESACESSAGLFVVVGICEEYSACGI